MFWDGWGKINITTYGKVKEQLLSYPALLEEVVPKPTQRECSTQNEATDEPQGVHKQAAGLPASDSSIRDNRWRKNLRNIAKDNADCLSFLRMIKCAYRRGEAPEKFSLDDQEVLLTKDVSLSALKGILLAHKAQCQSKSTSYLESNTVYKRNVSNFSGNTAGAVLATGLAVAGVLLLVKFHDAMLSVAGLISLPFCVLGGMFALAGLIRWYVWCAELDSHMQEARPSADLRQAHKVFGVANSILSDIKDYGQEQGHMDCTVSDFCKRQQAPS